MTSTAAIDATNDAVGGSILIRISVPEQNLQKCLQFESDSSVWTAKQIVLTRLVKDVRDAMNYGLFLPPANGRSGKFLEEERLLCEYSLREPVSLEFRKKRRDYSGLFLDEKHRHKINTKVNQKKFLEHVSTGNVDKTRKLLAKGLDPNYMDEETGVIPLALATTAPTKQMKTILLTLIEGGAHLDFRSKDGQTAMHKAAIEGNVGAIEVMLDLGASLNYRDKKGLTPLYCSAVVGSNPNCFELLLKEESIIMVQDAQGWQEIHHVCKKGLLKHLEHLLFYGVNMDAQNSTGNTALHIAAINQQEACVRVLLFRGANKEILNHSNQTAYQVAVISSNYTIARLIEQHVEADVVRFRDKPTYNRRRRPSNTPPVPSSDHRGGSDRPRILRSAVSESSLLAASALAQSSSGSLVNSSPRMTTRTAAATATTTVQPPNGHVRPSPSSPVHSPVQRRSSFSAKTMPSSSGGGGGGNATTIATDEVRIHVRNNPYEALGRTSSFSVAAAASPSPRSILKKTNLSRESSPVATTKTLPRNVKFSSSTREGDTLLSFKESEKSGGDGDGRHVRLYPAVAGRRFIAVRNHVAKDESELSFEDGDEVELLFVGKEGFWEGRVGSRQGWFPSNAVVEMQSTGHMMISTSPRPDRATASVLNQLETRIITLVKGNVGLGFSVRGAKSSSPTLNFKPTIKTPSLQYVGTVDPGGLAQKAGLKIGDYILEINGKKVVKATHADLVKLIKSVVDEVKLTVTDGTLRAPAATAAKSTTPVALATAKTEKSSSASSSPAIERKSLARKNTPPSPELLAKILTSGLPRARTQDPLPGLATPPRLRSQSFTLKSAPPPLPKRNPTTTATYASSSTIYENAESAQEESESSTGGGGGNDLASQLAAAISKMGSPKTARPRSKSLSASAARKAADPIAAIAKLASERRARVEAKAAAASSEGEAKEKSTADDETSFAGGELRQALAARKARMTTAKLMETTAVVAPAAPAASSPESTTSKILPFPTEQRREEDTDVRFRALSDAASKRQMRPPRVSRSSDAAPKREPKASFDLSAVLKAVPPPASTIAESPTTGEPAAPPIVEKQTVEEDIDKAIALWGADETAAPSKAPADRDIIRLDDTEQEEDRKGAGWDDIVIPPPVDMAMLAAEQSPSWEEDVKEESSLHIVGINSPPPVETFLSPSQENCPTMTVVIPPPNVEAEPPSFLPPPHDDLLNSLIVGSSSNRIEAAEIDVSTLPPPPLPIVENHRVSPPANVGEEEEIVVPPPPPINFESSDAAVADELTDFDVSTLPPPVVYDHEETEANFAFDVADLPPPVVTFESEAEEKNVELASLPPPPPVAAFSPPPPIPTEPSPPPIPTEAPPPLLVEDELGPPPPVPSLPPPSLDDNENTESKAATTQLTAATETSSGRGFERKSFSEWTVGDVSDWLGSLGLEEYAKTFAENEIEGRHLVDMSKDDLKELGVARLGHRLTLGNAMAKLRNDSGRTSNN